MLKPAVSYSVPDDLNVRLVQVTDPHLFADPDTRLLGVNTAASLTAVLDCIQDAHHEPELLLATGDISQDYSPGSYRQFVELVTPLGLPCHYLPGNHDDVGVMAAHMRHQGIFAQQRILLGCWQILMLDSTVPGKAGGFMAEEQFELIEQAIAAEPARHVLLVMHHNPVLLNSAWLDKHWMTNGTDLLTRVAAYPQVKALLWGHVHQAMDSQYQGPHGQIKLLATPSSCIQFAPLAPEFTLDERQPGYRLLELRVDGSILTQVYRVPGNRFRADAEAGGY
ncbi:3',5'-cyclic-AMP phosphodiesterase [Shewanella salipaludis]|uniref:3',5'-cyclic-AMP phosphodiesterase n=1 Tax=Shewanella salipaludis TaxID=2723052 RepID=A0A972G0J8_9GAMM|nr:3',5'-cyclic-AMP phosphodiesterase [Shewanella salipaludis]